MVGTWTASMADHFLFCSSKSISPISCNVKGDVLPPAAVMGERGLACSPYMKYLKVSNYKYILSAAIVAEMLLSCPGDTLISTPTT